MHTLEIEGWTANVNGDFSGDVILTPPGGGKFVLPFEVLEGIVAEKVRRERISALESAEPGDLLK